LTVLDFIFWLAIPCGLFFLLICILHLKDDTKKIFHLKGEKSQKEGKTNSGTYFRAGEFDVARPEIVVELIVSKEIKNGRKQF